MYIVAAVFLINILCPSPISDYQTYEFVTWNVGQGLWTTLIDNGYCYHFDTGGEASRIPFLKNQVLKNCNRKQNAFYFSHWDTDHISYLPRLRYWLNRSCLASSPGGNSKSYWKLKAFSGFNPCPYISAHIHEIKFSSATKNANENSKIYIIRKILIPGDSPQKMEKIWIEKPYVTLADKLILGHHGSRTSTSKRLLEKLIHLKIAVASSNFKKYGHPHAEVKAQLKKFGVSLLETQVWGNIHFTFGN